MDNEKTLNFGKEVRQEREKNGISLRKMASLVEMSPSYLSKLERGLVAPPSEKFIESMSSILNIDRDRLMAFAGKVSSDIIGKIIENPDIAKKIRNESC